MYSTVTTLSSRLEFDECRQALLTGRPYGSDQSAKDFSTQKIETTAVSHSPDLRMRLAEPGLWIVPLAWQDATFTQGTNETVINSKIELSSLLVILPGIPGLLAAGSLVAALSGGGPLAVAFTVLLTALAGIAAFHLHTQARRDADVLFRQTVALLQAVIVPSHALAQDRKQEDLLPDPPARETVRTRVLPAQIRRTKEPPGPPVAAKIPAKKAKGQARSQAQQSADQAPQQPTNSPQWKVFRPIKAAAISKPTLPSWSRRPRNSSNSTGSTTASKQHSSSLQIETPRNLAGGMPARAVVLSTVDESRLGSMTTTLLNLLVSRPDGEKYQVTTLVLFMSAQERDRIHQGADIPVHYDPADPKKVVLDPLTSPQ